MKTLVAVIFSELLVASLLLARMLLADVDLPGIAMVIAALGSAIAAVYAAKANASAKAMEVKVAKIDKIEEVVGVIKEEAVKAAPIREEQAAQVSRIKTDLAETKSHINGMKDELLLAVRGEATAVGTLAGVAQEQARAKEEGKEAATSAEVKKVETKVDEVHDDLGRKPKAK